MWTLWTLVGPLAVAAQVPDDAEVRGADAAPAGPEIEVPLRIEEDERWTAIDLRATRAARAGLVIGAAGGALLGAGLAMAAGAEGERLDELPPVLIVTGALGAVSGPPMLLYNGWRANKALRQRGVVASSAPSTAAWTVGLSGVLLLPAFAFVPVTFPVWYTAVLALEASQLAVDQRARRAAGLERVRPMTLTVRPTPDGLLLAGTF